MKKGFTIDELRKSACAHLNPHLFEERQKVKDESPQKSPKNATKKVSKTKEWISKNLWYWCQGQKVELKSEHQFHPERKWRFDWAIPEKMIAIEYEGLMSEKSRHTTISGFTGDTEKYNAAQSLGWKVLRYTAKNYKSLLTDLNKFL